MNGRRAKERRRILRERNAQLLTEIRTAEARYLEPWGKAFETWRKGPALLFLPTIGDDYPPDLKQAVAVRREAAFTGRCPCGLEVRISPVGVYEVRHGRECPANWGVFQALAEAAGVTADHQGMLETYGR
ncbi:hypothetical protein ABZ690_36555 [Streptomyces sp. NPDC006967]|uniref:hypothetical protein n=1 Tax=Streptomyces sp. NPDC006967 TaxID=3156906 RepID=UPI0033C0DA9F